MLPNALPHFGVKKLGNVSLTPYFRYMRCVNILHYFNGGGGEAGIATEVTKEWWFHSWQEQAMFFFPKCPDRFWSPPNLILSVYQGLFPREQSGRCVKLPTHFHVVPKVKNKCSCNSTRSYTFLGSTRITSTSRTFFLCPYLKASMR